MWLPSVFFILASAAQVISKSDDGKIPPFKSQPGSRIIGGTPVKDKAYPWIVSIKLQGIIGKPFHNCAGILLDPLHILTVAQCVLTWDVRKVSITLGSSNLQDNSTQQHVTISSYATHPGYGNRSVLENDLAIILIWPRVNLTQTVQPFPLFPVKENSLQNLKGQDCITLGWGNTNPLLVPIMNPMNLQQVRLKVVDNEECQEAYRSKDLTIYDNMICAKGDGSALHGACYGDSGGPLLCGIKPDGADDSSSSLILAGLVTWGARGEGCGSPLWPTVFSRVPFFHDWILETVKKLEPLEKEENVRPKYQFCQRVLDD